ncbi:type II toxin-antitoxin system RnlB family antitoxin [Xanthomonas dyei]|uniref:type II toxin-antitoxin system RnlB family antitoxin n=1 Tax=Xanthomonas dyei TaxID=743699 RepID=UPI001E5F70C6|nr:type II toxin-antitoxin system RnlB family antitoxin [Xanthomonas dyei]MCC4632795.1 type II toxin-antitoxin system RnlB family antitoxin [Xanthomonas dyei pv. eucalypti]
MKNYAIVPPRSGSNLTLVLSTGIRKPHEELDQVEAELRSLKVSGDVIFDLLTSNASPTRRFFKARFNGCDFESRMCLERVECSEDLRKASAKVFSAHLEQFDFSLLSSSMRAAVERGIPV